MLLYSQIMHIICIYIHHDCKPRVVSTLCNGRARVLRVPSKPAVDVWSVPSNVGFNKLCFWHRLISRPFGSKLRTRAAIWIFWRWHQIRKSTDNRSLKPDRIVVNFLLILSVPWFKPVCGTTCSYWRWWKESLHRTLIKGYLAVSPNNSTKWTSLNGATQVSHSMQELDSLLKISQPRSVLILF